VYVEGRVIETAYGHERALVTLKAKGAKKLKVGEFILGGEKMYRANYLRKIKVNDEGFTTEVKTYYRKR
jgi:hypothetical protein